MKYYNLIIGFLFYSLLSLSPVYSQTQSNVETPDSIAVGPQEDEDIDDELEPKIPESNSNDYFNVTKDNFLDVPFADQYLLWDTLDIHPYQSRMNKFPDIVTLSLVDTNTVFAMPIKNKVNSDFGWRKWRYHYGIDLGLKVGDPIVSAFDGTVRVVRKSKSYGKCIVIRHDNGLETLYAHLSKTIVTSNQQVKAGEQIGMGGNTGRSTGPHLHFEIRYLGGPINPHEVIDFKNNALVKDTLVVDHCLFEYLDDIQKARYYTIRSGDSLSKIAHKLGVPMSKLCKLNGISKKTILRIGRRLRYT